MSANGTSPQKMFPLVQQTLTSNHPHLSNFMDPECRKIGSLHSSRDRKERYFCDFLVTWLAKVSYPPNV